MKALGPVPPSLPQGLFAGRVSGDPVSTLPRGGRLRRWCYAASGSTTSVVGAAVVDLGYASTAFAWALLEGRWATWERVVPLGRGTQVAATADGRTVFARGTSVVELEGDGSFSVDVPTAEGRLGCRITAHGLSPALLRTMTAGGGWNVTEKAAGYVTEGVVELAGVRHVISDAGGWRDWTVGRQDRNTVWRWAAAAGRSTDGRRVGLNLSTGMNDMGAGENVVWWDGRPYPLDLGRLGPEDEDPAASWVAAGHGWSLRLTTRAVRAADENRWLVRSRYTQPVGEWRGTLPDQDDRPIEVVLTGVAEDHVARW